MALTLNQKNLSATETILEQLRNDINNFVYDEHFITEAEVSAHFQVSRTPAREALNTLCQEGILDKIPRKGYLIRKLSFSELPAALPVPLHSGMRGRGIRDTICFRL